MPAGTKPAPGAFGDHVAGQLRAQKAILKLTDDELAERIDHRISRSQINYYLNGKKSPDIEELEALCIALDLDLIKVIRAADAATEDRHLS